MAKVSGDGDLRFREFHRYAAALAEAEHVPDAARLAQVILYWLSVLLAQQGTPHRMCQALHALWLLHCPMQLQKSQRGHSGRMGVSNQWFAWGGGRRS